MNSNGTFKNHVIEIIFRIYRKRGSLQHLRDWIETEVYMDGY